MDVARHTDPCQVIRRYRVEAGLTQAAVGARIGCSGTRVSRLETGGARHADVATLRQLAGALQIPPEELDLAPRGERPARPPAGIVGPSRGEDMRRRTLLAGMVGLGTTGAITGPHLVSALLRPAGELPDAEAATQLRRVRAAFTAGCYGDAARLLPPVIGTAKHSPRLASVLVGGYALASEIATKTNDEDLAAVAADRALAAAHRTGDTSLIGVAAQRVAVALRRDGHPADALTLLTSAIDNLTERSALSLRGYLLLTASYTAALAEEDATATAMLADADTIARHVPASTRFSAPIAAGYAISIHTVLGDTPRALDRAASIQPGQLPTPERQARTAVDAAHAWDIHGRPERAVAAFLAAERAAPEELRRASVRRRLVGMLDRPGHTPRGLAVLAARVGVSA